MKYLLLFLLLAPVAFGQSIQDRVNKFEKPKSYEVLYDEFSKETRITVDDIYLQDMPRYMSKTFRGSVTLSIPKQGSVIMYIAFHDYSPYDRRSGGDGKRPIFNNDLLRILADGTLIDIQDDGITYDPLVEIPLFQMEKIVNASTVKLQFGLLEGRFSDKDMVRLKNLFSLTKPQ